MLSVVWQPSKASLRHGRQVSPGRDTLRFDPVCFIIKTRLTWPDERVRCTECEKNMNGFLFHLQSKRLARISNLFFRGTKFAKSRRFSRGFPHFLKLSFWSSYRSSLCNRARKQDPKKTLRTWWIKWFSRRLSKFSNSYPRNYGTDDDSFSLTLCSPNYI